MSTPNAAPLAGVTVVAMEQAVAAPMCTRILADFGARVIKVENPDGGDFARHYDDVVNGPGGLAAHFVWCNRGKESVTLNTKAPAGKELLHRLLDRADVFVSNLAPGATVRLGVAQADLEARHPGVIGVEIDGYGPGGPISHRRAYDLLVQAESGSCAITGSPGMPAKPGPAMADFTTGLYAAMSIVTLLYGRERHPRSGPASSVEVSLFDVMTDVMGYALTYTRHSGVDQVPLGVGSPAVAPYGAYPTRDGHTVVLGTTNDREWQRVALEIIDRPDLAADARFATNPGRCAHRDILDEAIGSWCAQRDLADIQKTADAASIGNARFNKPSEVVAHPQLSARDRWRTVASPRGDIPALRPRRSSVTSTSRWARYPVSASTPTRCSRNWESRQTNSRGCAPRGRSDPPMSDVLLRTGIATGGKRGPLFSRAWAFGRRRGAHVNERDRDRGRGAHTGRQA